MSPATSHGARPSGCHRRRPAGSHSLPKSKVAIRARRTVIGSIVGSIVLLSGPTVTLAQAPTGNAAIAVLHLAPAEASLCTWAVSTVLASDLADMGAGMPDQNASLRQQVRDRYASDPTGFANVGRIVTRLLNTATTDYFGVYNRSIATELAGYGSRIRTACTK